ncbi:MAG: LemA family protein [Legionellales bacterium]|nr:LemA family protein [Legionellales bacterium]
MPYLIAAVILTVVLYFLYARIIQRKNTALAALSSIEVQLRKRYDLIPNLLKLAKRYMEHERSLIEEVTALRAQAANATQNKSPEGAQKLFEADGAFMRKFGSLNVAMENYPELKADSTVKQAMRSFADVEDDISAARRYYNSAVTDLNNAIEIFPGSLVAPLARAKSMPFYEDSDKVEISKSLNTDDYI